MKLARGTVELQRDGRTYTRVAIIAKNGNGCLVGYRPWMREDGATGTQWWKGADGQTHSSFKAVARKQLAREIRKARRLGYSCRVEHV